jgi:hypothetical protein
VGWFDSFRLHGLARRDEHAAIRWGAARGTALEAFAEAGGEEIEVKEGFWKKIKRTL